MTGFLLVFIFLGLFPRRWPLALIYAFLAFETYQLVHWGIGDRPNVYTLSHVWWLNTYNPQLVRAAITYQALLAPIWGATALHWRFAPPRLRRLLIVVCAAYLPLWALLAVWQESRLMLPLIVLALPVVTMRMAHVAQMADEKVSNSQSSQMSVTRGAKVPSPALGRVRSLRLRMRRHAT